MGILLVAVVVGLIELPILLMPGWRSFGIAVAVYAGLIFWITLSLTQPSGSCSDPNCGGGAMAGFLVGQMLSWIAWSVLGVLAIIKALMLADRR